MITNGCMSIFDAMQKISRNNFVIPAFQRSYVWTTDQVACLWDSILSDYPISTFLFWKIDKSERFEHTPFFQFIKKAKFRNGKNLSEHENDAEDIQWQTFSNIEKAVLDGQQRLTSLYISLKGQGALIKGRNTKYAGEDIDLCIQLDKNALRNENDNGVQTIYDIDFFEGRNLSPTLFKIKNIMSQEFREKDTRTDEIENVLKRIPTESHDYARNILTKLCKKIHDDEVIQFQEISGIEDEALDMFIRFNNGGTRLSRSEIGEATIEAFWKNASHSLSEVCYYKKNKSYEKYLDNSLKSYHDFGLDFIIRLSKVLFETNINTNLNSNLVSKMYENWEKIKAALRETDQLIYSIRKLHVADFSNRWNILIPVIYLVYKHILPEKSNGHYVFSGKYMDSKKGVEAYLSRAILFKYYSNATTAKLSLLKKQMDNFKTDDGYPRLTLQILDNISELKVSDEKIEDLLKLQKGNIICEMALRLISSERISNELEYNPELDYDVDHIHPRTRFDGSAPDGINFEVWTNWRNLCDSMPNLSMLNSEENREVKNDQPLESYIQSKSETVQKKYKQGHFIPDTDLNLNNFGTFFELRKAILRRELENLLHKDDSDDNTQEKSPTNTNDNSFNSIIPPVKTDHHVYEGLHDMTDQEEKDLGNLEGIEEEIEKYSESQGDNDIWSKPILHEDNPVMGLAIEDRDIVNSAYENIKKSHPNTPNQ